MILIGCAGLFQNPLELAIPDQAIWRGEELVLNLIEWVRSDHKEGLYFEVTDSVGKIVDENIFRYLPVEHGYEQSTITVADQRGNTAEDIFTIWVH